MNDIPETHAVITARRHMIEVADAYEALGERMLNGPASDAVPSQKRMVVVEGEGQVELKLARGIVPLDLTAAQARMDIASWATYLARVLMDEVLVERYVGPPWTVTVVVEAWSPPTSDPAGLLRHIAENRIGHFTSGDPLASADFLDSAEEHARRARAAAWPTGARWIRLHVPCPEAGTSDMGERVPCGGEYRMWMQPGQETLGDMVCDRDSQHRISPVEWQRAMRRKGITSTEGAARLVRTIRLARGSVSA